MSFTDEQLAALAGIMKTSISDALKAERTESDKRLDSRLAKLANDSTSLEERIAAMVSDVQKPRGADKKSEPDDSDESKAQSAKLAALEAKLDAAEKARLEAVASSHRQSMLSEFRNEVSKHVPADRLDMVEALLHNAQGRIKRGEDGISGMNFKRDGYEEILSFDKAIPEWLKTDEGKRFIPALGAQGTGGGAGETRRNKAGEVTEEGAARILQNALSSIL